VTSLLACGWLVAASDLSDAQFCYVSIASDGRVVRGFALDDSAAPLGLLQNKPREGEACDVALLGVARALAGELLRPGMRLQPDVDGTLVERTDARLALHVLPSVATALELRDAGQPLWVLLHLCRGG